MPFILIGLIFFALGILGMITWWWFLAEIIKGLITLSLVFFGLLFVVVGSRKLLRGSKASDEEGEG
ncbi:MAG: hypothetical protein HQM08_08745 [Candidatus Riflebacteria bacterium]|nr:hypothetical protein [Candidatus Riflebacteria bacterium]